MFQIHHYIDMGIEYHLLNHNDMLFLFLILMMKFLPNIYSIDLYQQTYMMIQLLM